MTGDGEWVGVESVDQLVGAWQLVSWISVAEESGEVSHAMGEDPIGRLTYTSSGQMMGLMSRGDRQPFAQPRTVSVDRESGTDAEIRQAFNDVFGYAGSYVLKDGVVTHTIALCVVPGWEGVRMVRQARLDPRRKRLELSTPVRIVAGHREHSVLTWDRFET